MRPGRGAPSEAVQRSPIQLLAAKAEALRARGVPVIDLGIGDPDLPPPAVLADATLRALAAGAPSIRPTAGLPRLREALAAKLQAENGLAVDPERELLVTPGSKHALCCAILACFGPGDEVLLPEPAWPSYRAMLGLTRATVVPVPLAEADNFRVTPELLRRHVTAATRGVIVNTPTNPTGRVWTRAELAAVAAVVQEHDLLAIADEVYEPLIFAGGPHLSLGSLPGMADRTLTVNGFSKRYSMVPWRLGYVAGAVAHVAAVLKVQEATATAPYFVQEAGLAALTAGDAYTRRLAATYAERRAAALEALAQVPTLRCPPSEGTFFLFPDVSATGLSGAAFADWVLEDAQVVVTPGSAFGASAAAHVRLSLTAPTEQIVAGIERIGTLLARRRV